jgi:hypothetical protein
MTRPKCDTFIAFKSNQSSSLFILGHCHPFENDQKFLNFFNKIRQRAFPVVQGEEGFFSRIWPLELEKSLNY